MWIALLNSTALSLRETGKNIETICQVYEIKLVCFHPKRTRSGELF